MPSARALIRRSARGALRLVLSFPGVRRAINAWYSTLDSSAGARRRARFHRFASQLYQRGDAMKSGTWEVRFAGRSLILPLRADRAWLDWENAVSITGHEIAVKELYRAIIADRAVDLFLDVGANYGTHSLLFIAQGIPTVAFEPNHECHEYLRDACAINGFTPRLEPVGIGDADGELAFFYPEGETWLGTADPSVAATFKGHVLTSRVPIRALDDYRDALRVRPGRALLKIDVEGFEASVLRGATRILAELRPMVLFECWYGGEHRANRQTVYDLLAGHGYRVRAALDRSLSEVLSREDFETTEAQDFFADIPAAAEGDNPSGHTPVPH